MRVAPRSARSSNSMLSGTPGDVPDMGEERPNQKKSAHARNLGRIEVGDKDHRTSTTVTPEIYLERAGRLSHVVIMASPLIPDDWYAKRSSTFVGERSFMATSWQRPQGAGICRECL